MYHFSCVHVFSAAGLSMPSCLEHSGFQVTDTIHGIVYEPSKLEHPLQLSRLSLALGIKKCFCFCFVFKKKLVMLWLSGTSYGAYCAALHEVQ